MPNKFFFSLRYKIILAFFGIGCVLSVALGIAAHSILEEKLFSQLRSNVGNITSMGAEMVDKQALAALIARQQAAPDDAQAAEDSPEYKIISDQLNFIRDTEKELIRYVYLLTPTGDPAITKYVVDADVLALRAEGAADEDISHFNSDLEVGDFPVLQAAMRDRMSAVEDEYVYDEDFGVNSVSGYAPIFSADGKSMLALLGLDMADTEVRIALAEVLRLSLIVASLSLLVSLMTAVALGAFLTRNIIRLDSLVRSFAEKDFAVRSDIASNDEVGRLGSSFNHMAETIEEYSARLEALLNAYDRFVPHDLLRLLEKKSILDVNLGDQAQKEMSVLFSDIRNFTSISESLSPKDNIDFINSYLSRVAPRIRSHSGIIDKYIGDAVMALFPEKVEDALNAAMEMQEVVREYNASRDKARFPSIKIGIGVHTGKVMLGTIGEHQRMDGTVISDTVNVASRIENLTKKYGCNIIISDTVLGRLKARDKFLVRLVDKVRVHGKNEPVTLYEVYNADEVGLARLKHATIHDYSQGVDSYYGGDFKAAAAHFEAVIAANGNDIPAQMFLQKTQALMASGVPAGWDGISQADGKH